MHQNETSTSKETNLSRDTFSVEEEVVFLFLSIFSLHLCHFPTLSSIENDVNVGRLSKPKETLLGKQIVH